LKQFLKQSRRSNRLSGLVVLAVMVLVQAAAPCRMLAMQASPDAPAQVAPPATGQVKGQEAKTEQEENNQYRHSAIVQRLSRLLFRDSEAPADERDKHVETTARLLEFINFGVVFLAVAIPLVRIMPRILRKRSETLRSDIESARKVTEDANARLSAVEAKLASLGEEIAKFRSDVEQQIAEDEVRAKAALEEESARIVSSAEQEITLAATQARRSLRHFAADLAIEHAARQLVLTPETDRKLIAEFVKEAGTNGAGKGGQN
jgi:F-type H+-transporting ATPase subunit b